MCPKARMRAAIFVSVGKGFLGRGFATMVDALGLRVFRVYDLGINVACHLRFKVFASKRKAVQFAL